MYVIECIKVSVFNERVYIIRVLCVCVRADTFFIFFVYLFKTVRHPIITYNYVLKTDTSQYFCVRVLRFRFNADNTYDIIIVIRLWLDGVSFNNSAEFFFFWKPVDENIYTPRRYSSKNGTSGVEWTNVLSKFIFQKTTIKIVFLIVSLDIQQ